MQSIPGGALKEIAATVTMSCEENQEVIKARMNAACGTQRRDIVGDRRNARRERLKRAIWRRRVSGRFVKQVGRPWRAEARARHAKLCEHAIADEVFPGKPEPGFKHCACHHVARIGVFEVCR